MMFFLALNLQVAEPWVAMRAMPRETAAKEIAIRQAMAFPFLEGVCIGEPGHHAGFGRATAPTRGSIRPRAVAGSSAPTVVLRGNIGGIALTAKRAVAGAARGTRRGICSSSRAALLARSACRLKPRRSWP